MVEGSVAMSGEAWVVNSDKSLHNFKGHVDKLYEDKKYLTFRWKTGRQRTDEQNNAIHLYCRLIATACNDAGYEMNVVSPATKERIEVPWTMESVKERVWRPVQIAKFPDRKSTTKLERNEVSEIAEVITRFIGTSYGIYVPFPSRETKNA